MAARVECPVASPTQTLRGEPHYGQQCDRRGNDIFMIYDSITAQTKQVQKLQSQHAQRQ